VRASTFVMVGFAVVFGLLAVFIAQSWLNTQAELRLKNMETKAQPALAIKTIVVAARSLRFGHDVNAAAALKEVPWPEDSVPPGAFSTIAELTQGGQRRIALTAIEPNEPILAWKITGPGQRATLSSLLAPGMRAVTVRVNDVEGVAGFVLPGDRVDIGLTRQGEKGTGSSDVVLQNVKVLAIDQNADERFDKPTVGRSATVEVDTVGAQKLSLAGSIGQLSLILRKAGDAASDTTRRITMTDLFQGIAQAATDTRYTTIGVRRGSKKDETSVPVEGAGRSLAEIN
jgi:pilus assembly protein CpaB